MISNYFPHHPETETLSFPYFSAFYQQDLITDNYAQESGKRLRWWAQYKTNGSNPLFAQKLPDLNAKGKTLRLFVF